MMCTPAANSAEILSLAAMPVLPFHQPLLHYDLPHHLLYNTLYGVEPFSRAANNTASRGVNLSLPFSVSLLLSTTSDAAYVEWRPLSHPPCLSHFFSPNPSFLLYHSLSCSCAANGDGEGRSVQVYMCGGGSERERVVVCIFLRR